MGSPHPEPAQPAATLGATATTLLGGTLRVAGRLDGRFFELLRALGDTGSLHKAARSAGYSYKGAWLLLETASSLARAPLVEASAGGRGGGGSRLTPLGLQLLAAWSELQQRHAAFLSEQETWLLGQPGLEALFRRIAMKTSARNQFAGTVTALQRGPTSTVVTLALGAELQLTASIATAAADRLGLATGQEAIALVKASEVVLVSDFAGFRLSACNQLAGTIARVSKGTVASLVAVRLPGGATVTASVTHDAVDALGLAVGQSACATFKAQAVMLAVAAD